MIGVDKVERRRRMKATKKRKVNGVAGRSIIFGKVVKPHKLVSWG